MNKYLAGTIAGLVATGPMTLVMELLHRYLPPTQRYPLPPRTGTMRVAKALGLHRHLDEEERVQLTTVSHFATGAVLGAIYAASHKKLRVHPVIKGAAFGVLSWCVNYLVLLPSAQLLSPATKHPAKRNALMIVAHLVWGITTALIVERLADKTTDN
ncbi:MAG: DUF1440 domain-containing protein [Abitibacteriaceae bacterium]|nr:DUF1440 domain-containing protein [Abditibacteriaceae bacterium]MBV9865656.1 DUF1440 domain-containing protein [Abditibacteriaceae bacterium]